MCMYTSGLLYIEHRLRSSERPCEDGSVRNTNGCFSTYTESVTWGKEKTKNPKTSDTLGFEARTMKQLQCKSLHANSTTKTNNMHSIQSQGRN